MTYQEANTVLFASGMDVLAAVAVMNRIFTETARFNRETTIQSIPLRRAERASIIRSICESALKA